MGYAEMAAGRRFSSRLSYTISTEQYRLRKIGRAIPKGGGMALEMKENCEKCEAPLSHLSEARICSYECTFCPACARVMDDNCSNCGGELVTRPRRKAAI